MGVRQDLTTLLSQKKILVVGAGGIGCELLKNIVLTGFKNIHVVDLDTIDVSNLNRQFLFRREHVGKGKAEVATAVVGKLLHSVNIVYDCDTIFNADKFGINFFKSFDLVLNALDNRAARNHVNRMCVSGDIPLIESGSAGYLGQVSPIIRNMTECYECQMKEAAQKTFPGCTIRNTPSEHIHCTTWAKHLFNQLFGEVDIDDDVSPDMDDEENNPKGENVEDSANEGGSSQDGKILNGQEKKGEEATSSDDNIKPPNTREWAEKNAYNPMLLLNKLFRTDIEYLLKMENLWKERRAPSPLNFDGLLDGNGSGSQKTDDVDDVNKIWTLSACARVFCECVQSLKVRKCALPVGDILTWDKDDEDSMRFVAACANIRATIFHIPSKSLFDIKSDAGNIIAAIATTNAIVAGMMVIECLKVLRGLKDKVRTVFITRQPNPRGKILVEQWPAKPNPKCFVCCSDRKQVFVRVKTNEMTLKTFIEKVLKGGLCMQSPDVTITLTGSIIVSSEEGETKALEERTLASLHVKDGSMLECDDFSQDLNFFLYVLNDEKLKSDEYKIEQDGSTATEPVPPTTTEPESRKRKSMVTDIDELDIKKARVADGCHTSPEQGMVME